MKAPFTCELNNLRIYSRPSFDRLLPKDSLIFVGLGAKLLNQEDLRLADRRSLDLLHY